MEMAELPESELIELDLLEEQLLTEEEGERRRRCRFRGPSLLLRWRLCALLRTDLLRFSGDLRLLATASDSPVGVTILGRESIPLSGMGRFATSTGGMPTPL